MREKDYGLIYCGLYQCFAVRVCRDWSPVPAFLSPYDNMYSCWVYTQRLVNVLDISIYIQETDWSLTRQHHHKKRKMPECLRTLRCRSLLGSNILGQRSSNTPHAIKHELFGLVQLAGLHMSNSSAERRTHRHTHRADFIPLDHLGRKEWGFKTLRFLVCCLSCNTCTV